MPTGIFTEDGEGRGEEAVERGGSSVGGIVAGVTVPLVLLTVVAVEGVITGVWLWRRYVCTVDIDVAIFLAVMPCIYIYIYTHCVYISVGIHCRKQQHKEQG